MPHRQLNPGTIHCKPGRMSTLLTRNPFSVQSLKLSIFQQIIFLLRTALVKPGNLYPTLYAKLWDRSGTFLQSKF